MKKNKSIEELIASYRKENNYLLKITNSNSNVCCVFFSSLGLYKYKDINALIDVHEHDKFEWKSISNNERIRRFFKKMIFVRDIEKVFYLNGINEKIDTIEKLALFLKAETEGMDVFLVGSSAGGYVSFVVSNYLDSVKRIYSFGGVLNLYNHSTFLEYLDSHNDFDIDKYSIVSKINPNSFIVHFCGSQNKESLEGINILYNIIQTDNCAIVHLASNNHAPRPTGEDIIKLLTCSDRHLHKLKAKVNAKNEINHFKFSIINLGLSKAIINKSKKLLLKILGKHEK